MLLAALLGMGSSTAWADKVITIWSEDFTGTVSMPSSGTNATYSAAGGTTWYNENTAGGTAPEIMLKKGGGTFTVSITDLKGCEGPFTLSYYTNQNSNMSVTVNSGASVTGSSGTSNPYSKTISLGSASSLTITFTATNKDRNVRLDNIVLTGTQAEDPSRVASPTFSPGASSVYHGTAITMSCETEGATIYYTTNGTTPTSSSTAYDSSSKPTITEDMTIKAIAIDGSGELEDSEVASADYTLKAPDDPTFSLDAGLVSKGASLTLTTSAGASIRYTTDGTTPTSSVGSVYSSPITINAAQTIKAIAYDPAGNTSSEVSKAYTVFVGDVVTFDATSDTGTSLSKNGVSFTTSATESSVFKFYKSSTTIFSTTNGKIKKIEFTGVSGYAISNMTASTGTLDTSSSPDGVWTGNVTSVTFTASSAQTRASLIKVYVARTAAPTFSVEGGEYSAAQSVVLTSTTDDADIYYTIDGSTPTGSSTAYSGAISVTETKTIKAIAIYDGIESAVSSATYTMNRPAAPAFDLAGCVFDEAFDLHLSTETGSATIYYTTDGTTPTTSSSVYSTKVAISTATTTVKAIAVKDGLTSDVSSATYTYDSRTTPTFSLSSYAVDLNVNVEGSVTLTTNHDGSITATSSDGTHMPISYNSSTKVCTFTASQAGDYTVTFSATGSDNYKNAEAVVNVSVTKKATTMAIETLFEDGKDLKTASEGLIEGTVKYNDVALSPQPTITYTSGTTSVATVDEDGIITFVKAGSTTITVAFAGNDEYEACQNTYELNLIDTTPQDVEVEIALNSTTLGSTTPNGKTATVKNVSVTTNKGSSANDLVANTAHVRMYKYSNMVIVAPMGYVIKNITFTEPSSDKTWNDSPTASTGTYSSKSWTGSANSVTFTFDAGQCRIASITVTLAETVTISSARFTTYVAKHNISFPAEVTAYIVTPKDESSVTLTAKASVPEGTAVVLEGDAGTYALPTIETEPEDVTGNKLHPSTGSTVGDGETIYSLGNKSNGVGFYRVGKGVTVPAGKAYLIVGEGGSLSVKEFLSFDFEDVPTGLNDVRSKMDDVRGEIFNLAGQKINRLQKGINIVNGKKIYVK